MLTAHLPCTGEDSTANAIVGQLLPATISNPCGPRRLNKLGKLFVPSVGPGCTRLVCFAMLCENKTNLHSFFGALRLRYDDTRVRPWNSHNIRERKGGECDASPVELTATELHPGRLCRGIVLKFLRHLV